MQGTPGGTKAKQSLEQVGKLLTQSGFAKQLAAGSISGCITGAVLRNVGKPVALFLGSGILVYQIAHYQGYVKQDWKSIQQLAQQKGNDLKNNSRAFGKIRAFTAKNKVFTAAFMGGFLIGISL